MTLIKSLPVTGLNFLGVGGQQVIDTHRQLRNVVAERLGPAYGYMFATPKRDGGGDIDWYVPDGVPDAPVRQWTSLAPEERARIRADIESRLEEIRDKAADLKQARDERLVKLGERLEKATEFPDDRFIFVVGDQPILVCWGARTEQLDLVTPVLSKHLGDWTPRQRTQAGASGTPVVAGSGADVAPVYLLAGAPFPWGTLLSLLAFLVLLAAITRTLVPACGVDGLLAPPSWHNVWCNAAVAARDTDDAPRLERELEVLKKLLAAKPCDTPQPRAAVPAPAPAPTPQPKKDVVKDVEDKGGKIGEINVVLRWKSRADLDLYVTCPNGERIYHGNRRLCGGELDVDMNFAREGRMSDQPVENIVFPEGRAAKGRYQVRVSNASGGSEPFEVIVRIKGVERRVTGVASGDTEVTAFEVD